MNALLKAFLAIVLLAASPSFAIETVPSADPPPQIIIAGNIVRSQGPIAYTADLTVTKAIMTAGGYAEFARARTYLIRNSKSMKINLRGILEQREKDIPLKPWDIIYIQG